MKRFINIATAFATVLLLGFLIGTVALPLIPRGGPHSDIVTIQIKPSAPSGQSI
jgi:hypothetical protein